MVQIEPLPTVTEDSQIVQNLKLILQKEPAFFQVVDELVGHLAETYKDKYEATKGLINTKEQMYSEDRGEIICTYQMSRYLQRFLAPVSYKKGGNKNDLYKIVHYALFAAVRKNKVGETKNVDIVDK